MNHNNFEKNESTFEQQVRELMVDWGREEHEKTMSVLVDESPEEIVKKGEEAGENLERVFRAPLAFVDDALEDYYKQFRQYELDLKSNGNSEEIKQNIEVLREKIRILEKYNSQKGD